MTGRPKTRDRHLLDAGCGRGGTAAYLQSHGWGQVTGLDAEAKSIARAQETYPDPRFVACDVCEAAEHVSGPFDLLTMFNVLYALPDHARALGALARVATSGARLLIFDNVDRGTHQDDPIGEAEGPLLPNPLKLPELSEPLPASGWRLQSVREIDDDSARCYAALIDKIERKRGATDTNAR